MKIKIVLSVFVLGAIAALSMFYLNGSARAATQGTVSPSVTVNSTLSLTLEDTGNVVWGGRNPGTSFNGTIQAKIAANSNWRLMVTSSTNNGLEGADGNNHISNLAFTSTAGDPSPNPDGSGVTGESFKDTSTNVWTGGTASGDCRVAIKYALTIPANQYAQAYTATHTYTLTSS